MPRTPSPVLDRFVTAALSFAAGYLVGVLMAPRQGEKTRQQLLERTLEGSLAAQQRAREVTEPLASRMRETAQDLTERHVPLAEDWDIVDGKELLRDLRGLPRR